MLDSVYRPITPVRKKILTINSRVSFKILMFSAFFCAQEIVHFTTASNRKWCLKTANLNKNSAIIKECIKQLSVGRMTCSWNCCWYWFIMVVVQWFWFFGRQSKYQPKQILRSRLGLDYGSLININEHVQHNYLKKYKKLAVFKHNFLEDALVKSSVFWDTLYRIARNTINILLIPPEYHAALTLPP